MILCLASGVAEMFNKTLCTILEKMVGKIKNTWPNKLPEALWPYRTTIRTVTQATSYSMVFGGKVVLSLKLQFPSLRVAVHEKMRNKEMANIRLLELVALDKDRPTPNKT